MGLIIEGRKCGTSEDFAYGQKTKKGKHHLVGVSVINEYRNNEQIMINGDLAVENPDEDIFREINVVISGVTLLNVFEALCRFPSIRRCIKDDALGAIDEAYERHQHHIDAKNKEEEARRQRVAASQPTAAGS